MLRAILGVIVTIGASYAIGCRFGENEKKSLEILISLKKLLTILAGEIRYSGTPLVEAFSIIGEYEDEYWAEYFAGVSEKIDNNENYNFEASHYEASHYEATYTDNHYTNDHDIKPPSSNLGRIMQTELENSPIKPFMKKEDVHEFIRFGNELVCFDRESQLGRIELYIERIEKRIEYLEKSIDERVRLYRILGATGGIFITILMI